MAKAKKKKTNPTRLPVSQADLKRAKQETAVHVTNFVWGIVFTVLRDKEGYDLDGLRRVWDEVERLAESVHEGRCTISDLKDILKKEEGVLLRVQSPGN